MSRIAYVNGRYLPHRAARVSIEDRGFQFADAVYEVVAVRDGVFVDADLHLARLKRSLEALRIAAPIGERALRIVLAEVARRNGVGQGSGVGDGIVYLQISRGAAPRDFPFPLAARPTLVVTARRAHLADPRRLEAGVAVVTTADIRWARPDIKSVSLLPNVLGKQQAKDAGAYEAWQLDRDGCVTEGTSSNAWIVTEQGAVATHPATHAILNGVTRQGVLRLLAQEAIAVEERRFTLAEALAAPECFLTSASNFVVPVVRIDGSAVGDGRPGPVTRRIAAAYGAYAAAGGDRR